jgi:mRNA interferase MazF
MSPKDFSDWLVKKTAINDTSNRLFFHEREIWWTSIGYNVGDEEDGKGAEYSRPVLIFRKFNQSFFYGIPLSTTTRRGQYYLPFISNNGDTSVALLSHMRDYSAKRLLNKQGVMNKKDYIRLQAEMEKIIMRLPA